LDDHLHGTPVQYREIEHHESARFLSYFRKRFICQKGGISTGFHHISQLPPQDDYRLYRIGSIEGTSSQRQLFVHEVAVKGDSVVQGNVYVLDRGHDGVWQLNTKSSTHAEKYRGAEFARELLEGRDSGNVTVYDEDGHTERKFLEAVKASSIPHKPAPTDPEPSVLYRISDDSNKVSFEKIESPIRPNLDSTDAFLLDSHTAIYVWIGKDASQGEQKIALRYGEKYLHDKLASGADVNAGKSLIKVLDGHEPDAFEAAFPYSVR